MPTERCKLTRALTANTDWGRACLRPYLAADAEALDQSPVALRTAIFQIFQQLATPGHHRQQTAPRVMVFLMRLEMFSQLKNTLAQKGNLYLWRS